MSMEITINLAAPELAASINNLADALAGSKPSITAMDVAPAVKPERTSKKTTEEKPTKPEVKVDKPAAAPEPDNTTTPEKEQQSEETVTYTLVQVREKLADLSRKGKQAEVKSLIAKFGGTKLSDIKEDCYSDLMKEAEALQ